MTIIKEYLIKKTITYDCKCDLCETIYTQSKSLTNSKRKRKLANGRDLCKNCAIKLNKENIAKVGAKVLKNIDAETRKKNASIAGKISSLKCPHNKGRFTTERWNVLSDEEKYKQVKRANDALQEKLKDPIEAENHYTKIYTQTSIGYISKGHKDLHESIETLGFKSHVQIGRMTVDECNEDLKIVIEYNGDMWHCNPKTWKSGDYNTAIKMTAGEKWNKDIARKVTLRKEGYYVIVIWESSWLKEREKCIQKIEDIYNEISVKKSNTNTNLL